MGEEVSIQSICRTCLEPTTSQKYPLTGAVINLEVNVATMLEFCTTKKLDLSEDLPDSVCVCCFKTIRIAYRFLKQFYEVQDQINASRNKDEASSENLINLAQSFETKLLNIHNHLEVTTTDENEQDDCLYEEQIPEESFENETDVKIESKLSPILEDNDDLEPMEFLKQERQKDKTDLGKCLNLQDINEESNIEFIIENQKYEDTRERLYRYICPICGKQFCRADPFYNHILAYKINKITCTRCHVKPEYEIQEYFKHYREFHRYQCDICDKTLTSNQGHHYHMKQHKNIKSYKCPFEGCQRSYIMRHILKKHIKSHTRSTPYSCQLCPSIFNTNDSLRYHHLKVHDNKKDHLCTVCGRTFFQAVHLRDHMYRHLGYKKFICDICGKGFITNATLKKHIICCTKKHNN